MKVRRICWLYLKENGFIAYACQVPTRKDPYNINQKSETTKPAKKE